MNEWSCMFSFDGEGCFLSLSSFNWVIFAFCVDCFDQGIWEKVDIFWNI